MSLIFPNQTLGIVTEYNPFHNGHLYHIQASKKITGCHTVIAIMSGHFTQRGEPAIFDPWTRARWALQNGVDVVIELPILFSTASAAYFAHGAISLLNALGVDTLCFGSESGDITHLQEVAQATHHLKSTMKHRTLTHMDKSYSTLRSELLHDFGYEPLSKSNDILGIAYLESLLNTNSSIKPHTIKRIANDYHSLEIDQPIASATAIRNALADTSAPMNRLISTMPVETYETLSDEKASPIDFSLWHQWLLFLLRRSSPEALFKVHDMPVGLPERLVKAASQHTSFTSFEEAIQTKIYTRGRLRRVLAKLALGIEKGDLLNDEASSPEYIRLLGFTQRGRAFLNQVKPTRPIITNGKYYIPDSPTAKRQWTLDNQAANLYALLKTPPETSGAELRTPPIYLK